MLRPWIAPTRCVGCGALHRGRICDACTPTGVHRAPRLTPLVAGTWALAGYDSPLAAAVRAAKYGRDRPLTRELGRILASRLPDLSDFDAVVPAPSPWTRRVRRGFCPAAVLGAEVAARHHRPLHHALSVKPGPPQASLTGSDRRRSLRGRVRTRRQLTGRVLLIDDVATTGATAEACAQELLGDGVFEVWLAVVCQRRDAE